jgi:DNA processing protein
VSALLLGSADYPAALMIQKNAPPVLFHQGNLNLLNERRVGLCGSRNASDEGLRAAAACGDVAAQEGLAVVSGYARGVDMAAHIATLNGGGSTIIVLPEGISHFRIKRGEFAAAWDPDRVLVISQFSPDQPWTTHGAMARNGVIFGLGLALVVVEAGERGGTLSAGLSALEANRTVIVLEFSELPRGNQVLIDRGAIPVSSRVDLVGRLRSLSTSSRGNQLSLM